MATYKFWGKKLSSIDIPLSFFTLAFHNELEYRHLNERTSCGDDGATSCYSITPPWH